MTEATLRIKVDSSEVKTADKSLADLSRTSKTADGQTQQLTQTTEKLSGAAKAAATAFAALGVSLSVREIIQANDAWVSATNQLRLVTTGTENLTATQQSLLTVAKETRSSFESTVNLYARLARATTDMGLSQTDLLGITETINQSFAVSGATASEAAAAITQLSQGLAAGALRGDEFNSVAEQAPGIMRAIADSLNMTVGELRAFAAEGGITAEIVVNALQQASASIESDFNKAAMTFGQAIQEAETNLIEFAGTSDGVNVAVSSMGGLLITASENLGTLAGAAEAVAAIYAGRLVGGYAAATAAAITQHNAIKAQTAATLIQAKAEVDKTAATVASTAAELNAARATAARMAGMLTSAGANAALASAETAATTAANAHAAALGRLSVATAAATTTTSSLSTAMALLGGPAGVFLIASYATYKFTESVIDADSAMRELYQRVRDYVQTGQDFESMSDRMAAAQRRVKNATEEESEAIQEATDYVQGLFDELDIAVDTTTAATNETVKFSASLDLTGVAAALTRGKVGGLESAVARYGEKVKITADLQDAHVEAMEDARREQARLEDQYRKSRDAMDDAATALENEMLALQMTARAAAVFEAVTRATAEGALPAEIARVAELTARVYDMREAKESASNAAQDLKDANDEAARVAADAWGRTHEFLSDTFVDIFDEGGSAFEKVGDMAVATAKRIAAEWLALKAMNLFGIETPEGAGKGGAASVITSILGQIGGKPAGNAVVSEIVKGGVGGLAGTVGATGTTAVGVGAAAGGGGMLASIGGAVSGAGSAVMSGLAAIPGWGWALGGAALLASQLSKDETPSSNAGFLIRPVADDRGRTFDVPAFASGFDPVGFARREDQGAAVAVIDTFRQYDAALTQIANAAGISVNYDSNNFGGFSEKGTGGGLFFGSAAEDGRNTAAPIEQQVNQFVGQWIKGLSGQVDQSLINDVLSAGSADEMVKRAAKLAGVDGSHASGLDFVPFDGYRAELHRGERVQTASEARNMESLVPVMAQLLQVMNSIARDSADSKVYNRRSYEILDRWQGEGFPVTA